MSIFNEMDSYDHEQIVFGRDEKTGLKCIIAVHNTNLGPALGGTRMWDYKSEEDALYDVLRLSRGMSLKNAAGGLKNGGGKAVIIGDPKKLKSPEFFRAYGRIVNSLGGKYYTAEDVNTTTDDIKAIHEVTEYVTGTPEIGGNPSPFTARGVYKGMKAGAKVQFGTDSLKDKVCVVMGLGSVGYRVAEHIHEEGGILKVYDIKQENIDKAVKELGATYVSEEELLTTDCDIFVPCALGAVLNKDNVRSLKCKLVAGAANNVLVDAETGKVLQELGILYLPDYIINAGGVINCGAEIDGSVYNADEVTKKCDAIYDTTLKIIELAQKKGITTYEAADEYAMDIIKAAAK